MATIRETILSFPGIEDAETYLDNVVLPGRDLDGSKKYSRAKLKEVNLAAADTYAMIGGLPDFSENKLSISYPRDWYTQKAKELYTANGEADKANALGKQIKVPRGRARRSW